MNFREEKSIYLQIEEYICEQVLSEKWMAGGKILSVREFAASLEVNPNTVMRAYTELADKGILENKRGVGFFVAENAPTIIRETLRREFLSCELPSVLKKAHLLNISLDEISGIFQTLEK